MPLQPTDHPLVRRDGNVLFTLNLVPGKQVYRERLVIEAGEEYRAWSPSRSKLAALLLLHPHALDLATDASVLYLGGGTGTTVSHLSDLTPRGTIFAVEVAPRPFEKLLLLAGDRPNVVPVMGDARDPSTFRDRVGDVDLLYQDVAQRDQTGIFLRNLPSLRPEGQAILMLKARSVDVVAEPKQVFARARRDLGEAGVVVDRVVSLTPYQKDHAALLLRPGLTR
ncbi:MAG: fibrillarin-like rRNA/tRNA 2'-O-methyltransferase [Thermoplasmata archaeon]|nr:fibrillarin-like rRNA/tRNA 2'-O-methyltransferase [Thermoplasmata archaeon]